MYKLIATSAICMASVLGKDAVPSSLLQISSSGKKSITASDVMSQIQKQLDEFHKQMDQEVAADKEEVRNLKEQQRKMDRDERAFKSKVFGNLRAPPVSSFVEGGNPHFGDPYIDEAMRTFGEEIETQKRDLERVLATEGRSSSLAQEKDQRPELGLISAALKTRLAMVGKN